MKEGVGKNFHKVKLTITIDENNFYDIHQEDMRLADFENFPSRIQILSKLKIPFIGFLDNSSVVAVHKESDGYKFLEKWNGQCGKETFISFDKEKPQFGLDALN
uniref:Uncharacterized protein n=1 Tax=Panagrolaimus sp. PS1159 TaxID=55785 RepID=A0AC35GF00_9BILA